MWDDILAEPLPQSDKLYATTVATAYYARGIAYASKGLVDEAEMEQVSDKENNHCVGSVLALRVVRNEWAGRNSKPATMNRMSSSDIFDLYWIMVMV